MSERVKEIRERLEKATPGPWEADPGNCVITSYDVDVDFHPCRLQISECGPTKAGHRDSEFIAHARQDIPFLLSELERVEGERDEARENAELYQDPGYCHRCGACGEDLCCSLSRCAHMESYKNQYEQLGRLREQECDELNHLRSALEVARNALQLVSYPKRDDGTYNRSREACERLAAEALSEIARIECGKE